MQQSRRGIRGRAGELRDAVHLEAVDLAHAPVPRRRDLRAERAPRAAAPARPCASTISSKLGERRARVERALRRAVAAGVADRARALEQPRGQVEALLAQVERARRGSRFSTASTSSASSRGPTPRPIGRVRLGEHHVDTQLDRLRDARGSAPPAPRRARVSAPSRSAPPGCRSARGSRPPSSSWRGSTRSSGASVSMPIGRSTVISTSSAGARSSAPPHAMQAPVRSTTLRIRSGESATSASAPIVSAVPDGLVIARDEVFGTVRPSAARIGTTTSVVRLPGMPPMQCLSATTSASKREARAARDHRLGERDSSRRSRLPQRAGEHEHRELGLRVAARAHVGAGSRRSPRARGGSPRSFRRTRSTLSGARACVASTGAPSGSPRSRNAASESPISSGASSAVAAEVEDAAHLRAVAAVRAPCDHAHAVERLEAERARPRPRSRR